MVGRATAARATAVVSVGISRSRAPRSTRRADRFLAAGLEILEVAEQQHPARGRPARTAPAAPIQAPSDSCAPSIRAATTPPDQCDREADEQQRRQPPAAECRPAPAGTCRSARRSQRRSTRRAPISSARRLLEHLGVVFQREAGRGQAIPDIRCHGTEIPAAHARHHVDVPGDRIPADHARASRRSARRPPGRAGRSRRPDGRSGGCARHRRHVGRTGCPAR